MWRVTKWQKHKPKGVICSKIQCDKVIDTRTPDNVIHNGNTKVKGQKLEKYQLSKDDIGI